MIRMIWGAVKSRGKDFVVVRTEGGVGYQMYTNQTGLQRELGIDYEWQTHLIVRENVMQLYGFCSRVELRIFEQLIEVSGVGPKGALAILNLGPADMLQSAILQGDDKYVAQASGIGKKTASKVILELKDRLDMTGMTDSAEAVMVPTTGIISSQNEELVSALEGLGYGQQDIRAILPEVDTNTAFAEQFRQAMKFLRR